MSGAWVYLKSRDSFLDFKKAIFTFPINYILSPSTSYKKAYFIFSACERKRLKGITSDILETSTQRSRKHTLRAVAYWGGQWTWIYAFWSLGSHNRTMEIILDNIYFLGMW